MSPRNYKLSMLKIPVRDVEKSVIFYEQSLGFKLEFLAAEYGWAQMQAGEVSLALYVPGMGGGQREIGGSIDFHLVIAGSDFDEMADVLLSEGMLAEDRVHRGADGTTFIDIRDPDGNLIKVFKGS